MANPCETHRNFTGDVCPVCLMQENEMLRKAIQAQWESYQLGRVWSETMDPVHAESIWRKWARVRKEAKAAMIEAFKALGLETENET